MASKTHDEYKNLVQTSGASEKRSKRGMISKALDPAGLHTDTSQPIIKGSGFKMKGFPQHAGVSPLRDDVPPSRPERQGGKVVINEDGKVTRTETQITVNGRNIDYNRPEPKTKLGKWVRKHKKLDEAYLKARAGAKKFGKKINKLAGSDAGKAVIAGLTNKATTPRPKKEIVAIIEGEQKSIM